MADILVFNGHFLHFAVAAAVKKWPLWAILTIAVLTPILSTALFFAWRPAQQTNHGEILPPRAPAAADWRHVADGRRFSPAEWRGTWALLAVADGDCDAACRRRLCRMRQLRLLLPGHYLRLRRVWLLADDAAPPPTMPMAADCGEAIAPALRRRVRQADVLAGVTILRGAADGLPPAPRSKSDYLYLIDPAGVWAMRFTPELTTKKIRQDLSRLLKLSKGRRLIESERPPPPADSQQ